MSNYRNGYLPTNGRAVTPKQARRVKKKMNRDVRNGGAPTNPTRPTTPRRHRDQPPLSGSIARYIAVRDLTVRNGHPRRRLALIPRVPAEPRHG